MPLKSYPVSKVEEAFRYLQQGKSIHNKIPPSPPLKNNIIAEKGVNLLNNNKMHMEA
jgi:hypothetical protein